MRLRGKEKLLKNLKVPLNREVRPGLLISNDTVSGRKMWKKKNQTNKTKTLRLYMTITCSFESEIPQSLGMLGLFYLIWASTW